MMQNHEYLADKHVLQNNLNPGVYRAALLNQTFGGSIIPLTNSFNFSFNKKRFNMMNHTIQSPFRKLKLLLILPVFVAIFYAFATPEYQYNTITEAPITDTVDTKILVGKITWEGNTVFTPEELNKAFGLKTGETYSIRLIKQRFIGDAHRLYQDKGYLSSVLEVIESPVKNGTTDIKVRVSEGEQSKIGQIEIIGNNKVSKEDILKTIKIKSGDPYDRKIINQLYHQAMSLTGIEILKINSQLIMGNGYNNPVNITLTVIDENEESQSSDSPLSLKIFETNK